VSPKFNVSSYAPFERPSYWAGLSGHWHLLVLVSPFIFFCCWLPVLDYADHRQLLSPRQTLLSYRNVSYRIRSVFVFDSG